MVYAQIDPDYLAHWYFPTGSSWMYKVKDKELYDSVIVRRSILEARDETSQGKQGNQMICQEYYEDILNHSYYNKPEEKEQFFAYGSNDNPRPVLTYRTKLKKNFPIYLYYDEGDREELDSLLVGDIYYKNVLIFNSPQYIAFAKNVGIIEVMGDDSLLWQLQTYHITR